MLCGAGCGGAHDQVVALAQKLLSPIVHPLRGKEHMEYDNPFDVGMTGLVGFASGYWAMKSCDMLLMLGTDFPYRQFFPENAQVAQVDLRPEALGNRCSTPRRTPPTSTKRSRTIARPGATSTPWRRTGGRASTSILSS
jgi:pyruvate dehydrogenase (quinone)